MSTPSRRVLLVTHQSRADAQELAAAVASFDALAVDPADCVENARRFDSAIFREAFPREVEAALIERHAELAAGAGSTNGSANGHAPGAAQPPARGTRIS